MDIGCRVDAVIGATVAAKTVIGQQGAVGAVGAPGGQHSAVLAVVHRVTVGAGAGNCRRDGACRQ